MGDLRGRYSYDFGMDVLISGLEAQLVHRQQGCVS
jgi:hypothetical protein